MFAIRDNNWEKDVDDEGPLRLQDLHKKHLKEQEYAAFGQDYEEKKKKRRDERKSKGSKFGFGAGKLAFIFSLYII